MDAPPRQSKTRTKILVFIVIFLLDVVILLAGITFSSGQSPNYANLANLAFGIAGSITASLIIGLLFLTFTLDDERVEALTRKLSDFGVKDFVGERHEISIDDTIEWFKTATDRLEILTVFRHNWTQHPNLIKVLTDLAKCGRRVRIIIVDPESELGKLFHKKQNSHIQGHKHERDQALELLNELKPHASTFETTDGGLRALKNAKDFLFCSILRVDNEMRVNLYLQHKSGEFTPVIILRRAGHRLWDTFQKEFDILYERAVPIAAQLDGHPEQRV